jgi:phytoene dehydrogenase-like protein
MLDAVVVGSGPNGLTAAITLAASGRQVVVLEAAETIGGGTRTRPGPVAGAVHDVCSAVHPLAAASPALLAMPLSDHGLQWVQPEVALAHTLDAGRGAAILRDLGLTCVGLGDDGPAWRATVGVIAGHWQRSLDVALATPIMALRRPFDALWLARRGLSSARRLARRFATEEGRGLVGGLGAHAAAPLDTVAGSAVALVLGAAAHTVGWPFASGGSASITSAMAEHFRDLGGVIETNRRVRTWDDLPEARTVILTTSPEAAIEIAGDRIGRLTRLAYRTLPRGPGVFKIDAVVDGPIPWEYEPARRAGTVHAGGTFEDVEAAEAAVAAGSVPARPFVIAAQPTVVDPTRAPNGSHVLWAYCHVPFGSTHDMTGRIVAQIERFAPGFEARLVSLQSRGPVELRHDNANHVGGDITGGALCWRGLLARPTPFRPHRAARGIYLGSTSTPPGAGVHGMCGYHAAHAALHELKRGARGEGRGAR